MAIDDNSKKSIKQLGRELRAAWAPEALGTPIEEALDTAKDLDEEVKAALHRLITLSKFAATLQADVEELTMDRDEYAPGLVGLANSLGDLSRSLYESARVSSSTEYLKKMRRAIKKIEG